MNQEVIYEQRRLNWFRIKAFIKYGPEDVCFWCKEELEGWEITKDHVIPASRRAPYYIDYNKVNCCLDCNGDKGDMFPTEWRKKIIERTDIETKDSRRLVSLNQLIINGE